MLGSRRKKRRPCTVILLQGRDIWLQATPTEVRSALAEADGQNDPVRFPLYNGDGDVLVDAGFVGAVFVPSSHQMWEGER